FEEFVYLSKLFYVYKVISKVVDYVEDNFMKFFYVIKLVAKSYHVFLFKRIEVVLIQLLDLFILIIKFFKYFFIKDAFYTNPLNRIFLEHLINQLEAFGVIIQFTKLSKASYSFIRFHSF